MVRWKLTTLEVTALLGLDPSETSKVENILTGFEPLEGQDMKDRFVCLLGIVTVLDGLLQDEEVENEWLREPHSLLDDDSPMSLLLEGSMSNMIAVMNYVSMAGGL